MMGRRCMSCLKCVVQVGRYGLPRCASARHMSHPVSGPPVDPSSEQDLCASQLRLQRAQRCEVVLRGTAKISCEPCRYNVVSSCIEASLHVTLALHVIFAGDGCKITCSSRSPYAHGGPCQVRRFDPCSTTPTTLQITSISHG
jgi:hypothetical protein